MKRICIDGKDDDRTGYGRMVQQLRAAFMRRGFAVDNDPATSEAEVVVFAMIPNQVKGWRQGARPVMFTMWETDELPLEFRGLAQFSNVLVPSKACAEAFSRFHPNVDVIPLGVDERWGFQPRPTDGPFTFLTSGHERRKGWDATIEAFQKAFPGNDDVRLIIKGTLRNLELRAAAQDPRITVVEGYLSANDEIALYASANCYIGLSRGEGFGLMPLQAIRQGCPTIVSAGHGHAEYAQFADAVVPTTMVPADNYGTFGAWGAWWEPDVAAAAKEMRLIYERYGIALDSIEARAVLVADIFTWDNTAAMVELAIGGSFGTVTGDGWVEPDRLEYGFEVNAPVKCDIGPHRVDAVPGDTVWFPANVYRTLADAGFVTGEPQVRYAGMVPA